MPDLPNEEVSIRLDTALGNPIMNSHPRENRRPVAEAQLEAAVMASHTQALRGRSHPNYNCHGLTFASRRTGIPTQGAEIRKVLSQDGYIEVNRADVLPGDILLYWAEDGSLDHSALVVSRPQGEFAIPEVASKWGWGPEVLHSATDCDYDLADLKFYRLA